ncbi:MAG: mannose-1-phosphate guanylyltransferase [Saprospiraceae bacterium]|nr:mannose-1-phosphate guanylyltransferase [Saprospiraceae bacterium]
MNRYIAIMAGGIGSRFWPSSTTDRPKQFLDILGVGKSLIRMTFERVLPLCPAEQIMVLTNKKYKALVMEHLPELPEKNILCEPSMNNTAPCIAYMALKIGQRDPEASFAVLPSDHVILKEDIYRQKLDQAFLFAENNDALVTLGISPTRPDTGYGYINYIPDAIKEGVYKVAAFKEKPDEAQAQKYLASGQYLWNAGMFVWSVRSILASFRKNASEVMDVLSKDISAYNTDREQAYIDEVYPDTENISIDYAILERADNVYTLPSDIGWSDLGTWSSLHAYMSDKTDQVTIGSNIHLINSNNIIVMSNNDKTIVINGLKDYIVVDEDHALMIYPKSDEQEIKEVVKRLS